MLNSNIFFYDWKLSLVKHASEILKDSSNRAIFQTWSPHRLWASLSKSRTPRYNSFKRPYLYGGVVARGCIVDLLDKLCKLLRYVWPIRYGINFEGVFQNFINV